MSDTILQSFLARQLQEGMQLAEQSDILDLKPLLPWDLARSLGREGGLPLSPGQPADAVPAPDAYLARFSCISIVRRDSGEFVEAAGDFTVGIRFPSDYLRRVSPARLVTWLDPPNIVHPNIMPPGVCIGRVFPGMSLVDLLYQCYEIITYLNWAPHDPLNETAAQWARSQRHRFPIDPRPLKRVSRPACSGNP